jgi:hypothetical protein
MKRNLTMKSTSSWMLRAIAGVAFLLLASCGGGGPRQLIGISVQPVSGQAIAPDGTVPFSATGTFDQAPTTQANLPVQWASSDLTIATIDPNTGIATCLVVGGPVTVTSSAAGRGGTVHGSSTLACQLSPDPVVKLDPASLVFTCRNINNAGCQCEREHTTRLTNVGGATLAIDSISIQPILAFLHTDTCGTSVDPGQSCSIDVTVPSWLRVPLKGELDVNDNAADSPQRVSLSVNKSCTP